jgi:nitroreductase
MNDLKEASCLQAEATDQREIASELRYLADAAARAPSGDNMQPWCFKLDPQAACLELYAAPDCDPSPMNSAQRMTLIACGAALENALIAAHERGWRTHVEVTERQIERNGAIPLARIRLLDRIGRSPLPTLPTDLAARVTNRKRYDARPLSPQVLDVLKVATQKMEGFRCCWLADRSSIETLATLIGRADAIMFSEPSMRRSIFSNVRFDLPPDAEAEEGLPVAALELSVSERMVLPFLKDVPNTVFKISSAPLMFAARTRSLVRSCSALFVIDSIERPCAQERHTEIRVGQVLQRAWLALTKAGLAAQPMMSLVVLDNALRHGSPDLITSLERLKAPALLSEFRAALRHITGDSGRPGFLLRLGYAPPPSARSGRTDRIQSATTGA